MDPNPESTTIDTPFDAALSERYLVYAGEHEGQYVIGVCTRTARLRDPLSQADLQVLGPPQYQRP